MSAGPGPRRSYPVARGVVPPPGAGAPAISQRVLLGVAICFVCGCMLVGWFIFAGPGASFLRSFNYQVPDEPVTAVASVENAPAGAKRKQEVPAPIAVVTPVPVAVVPPPRAEPPKAETPAPGKDTEPPVLYAQVSGVFQAKCASCHGGQKKKGGLDVRTSAAIHKGGDSGPAVVTGKPDASTLWESVETGRMPPDKTKPLSAAEKELIWRWIESGAK